MRILLVEDNADLAASIVDYLEMQGHSCDLAFNGESGFNAAISNDFDMYIFDIAMPKMDGLQLCQKLRNQCNNTVPILFLTARDTLDDKLAGFSAGADDYLIKPFDLSELLVRLQAIYNRYVGVKTTLALKDLSVDLKTEQVMRANKVISLSPNTYKLLIILMQRSPEIVLRQELEHLVWGDNLPDSDSLRSHIYKLRSKIDKPFTQPLIKTSKGRGFSIS
ncbi:response regulator transcription factor [Litorilituus lipolyticus]|uniref:Response regulator transcription factor n=1 Tax=Litorilituus lipolyticus TaxID=2491017 RepID=A0A502KPC8_9GAMM|nr:response regulator transcription factor [Litorilituus lipolyticus]TPH12119.1 response regulator transcription factor [Litorilituus lipolyticus]